MSLLLTSCTMGKQPDRLRNKGPQYLRTRTNSGLFAQNKISAVELLAASKAQFYTAKKSVDLDKQQDLAVSEGQSEKYSKNIKKKEPVRSKSEYDISLLHLARTDEENDENNNDISDDSISTFKDVVIKDNHLLNLQNQATDKHISSSDNEGVKTLEDALNHTHTYVSSVDVTLKPSAKPELKLTFLPSSTSATAHEPIQISFQSEHLILKDEVDSPTIKKPVPLPRKLKEKPVPPPRKLSIITPPLEDTKTSNQYPFDNSITSCSSRYPSSSKILLQETSKVKERSADANVDAKSPVNSFLKFFPSQSVKPPLPEKPKKFKNLDCKTGIENTQTYTATAIFISKPANTDLKLVNDRVPIGENGTSNCLTPVVNRVLESSLIKDDIENNGKKRCPDMSTSVRAVERGRRDISSCTSSSNRDTFAPSLVSTIETVDKSNSFSTSTLEMSIESVDQAVYESEISAIPTASVESTMMQEVDSEVREITRSNSSLSGKFEQQNISPLSASPIPHCSSVPRSYSDISCHLEGQHSRDSSIVSSHSRLSHASVGTDLENFFNQMGLEKGILEPVNRLKELQTSEVFDSMSSLDSHDAASICSTYSCSDQEWSDSQSTDRSQQQTSIVERNARIIKWLCNVRKAKNQAQKSDSAAASNA